MSESLAARQEAGRGLTATGAGADNPLRFLPREFVPAVTGFILLNQHLLKSNEVIAARLGRWVRVEGLTVADLEGVFAALSKPEMAARHRFESDLMADLAAAVAYVLGRRRSQQAAADRQVPDRPAGEVEANRRKVREWRDGIGRGVDD